MNRLACCELRAGSVNLLGYSSVLFNGVSRVSEEARSLVGDSTQRGSQHGNGGFNGDHDQHEHLVDDSHEFDITTRNRVHLLTP